jgi:hypothetical protein
MSSVKKIYFRVYWFLKADENPVFNYGNWIEEKEFEKPDHNGITCLSHAWKKECENLDAKYPNLKHRVEYKTM